MCKITFFSYFVIISNVFTRFINDRVSLRIEPLTVRNCSPCKIIVFGQLDTNKLIVIVDALIGNALKSLKSFNKLGQFSLI